MEALSGKFHIEEVVVDTPPFAAVLKLHSANKSRLGLFPKGAFEEYARGKMLIAAFTEKREVAGYLLFRTARNRAAVVHLTSAKERRNQGVADSLMGWLKHHTKHLLGISLRCRRDYKIDKIWQRFGFTVRHSRQGRGADGAKLDYWWYDHNHEDLFSQAASRLDENSEAVLVAMDANVFFDLVFSNRPQAEDTRVLQADWLRDGITLCLTPELYNEIHRCPNESDKKRSRMAAQEYRSLQTEESDVNKTHSALSTHFQTSATSRNYSDLRHVAHAIVAEVPFFVTRDEPLLEKKQAILENFGLRVLHPTDLINRFDVLRREAEYRPARLEGSNWRERLLTADDVSVSPELFKHRTNERDTVFEKAIRHYLVKSNEWVCTVISESQKPPTLLCVRSSGDLDRIEVALLRHTNHPLAGTLLRHTAYGLARTIENGLYRAVVVSDPNLSEDAKAALGQLGFLPEGGSWWKVSIKGMVTQSDLITVIRQANIPNPLKERLAGAVLLDTGSPKAETESRLEWLFNPVKFQDSALPCFVVSIRPAWAQHFFDIPVGGQTLMDLNDRLHLGIEGAYYCSAKNSHLSAPARVLWYVSGRNSMCVKACSHLEERIIDTPRELYARFRHLGIYAWKHVFETANERLDQPLMAFRFSRTERFVKPVKLAELLELGIAQPQNPRKITNAQFVEVYKKGLLIS